MNEKLIGKKSIFYFPEGCIGYIDDDLKSFEKFEAHFQQAKDGQICFCVLIDDVFWIDTTYKLTDNESKRAWFGQVAKKGNGSVDYSSIHARVAAVYTAICEGKIKVGKINLVKN